MKGKTEEALAVVWEAEAKGQEEQDGLYCYGYWRGPERPKPGIPAWVWPSKSRFREYLLEGDDWRIVCWTVRLREWPPAADWRSCVRETLKALADAGARVAWCGLEGHFGSPILGPEAMSGGVWAALAPKFGFKCAAEPGKPFAALSDDELRALAREL